MSDYIVRATAADANIRAFAVTAKEMVETAREHHKTTHDRCGLMMFSLMIVFTFHINRPEFQ